LASAAGGGLNTGQRLMMVSGEAHSTRCFFGQRGTPRFDGFEVVHHLEQPARRQRLIVQSGRTRRAHDEASSKNLRRLPVVARAVQRSFVSTARKQGWNIIDALSHDPSNLAKSLRLS
jgi:hypothetical protein